MTFRQAMVCLFLGPVCVVFQIGCLGLIPLLLPFGMLLGSKDPIMDTWQIVTEPPIGLFMACYRGLDD